MPQPLHPSAAFVVQFRANTDFDSGCIAGRVEHVATAQAATFESDRELLALIARMLQDVRRKQST